jgi:hypothetical protein
LKGADIAEEFQRIVDEYVKKTYAPGVQQPVQNKRNKSIPIRVAG